MSTRRLLCALMLMSILGGYARAGITLVSGPGSQVVNPSFQRYYADPYYLNTVFYWTESTAYTLGSNLVVSNLPPGSFPADSTSYSIDNSLTISAGTVINSYLLNYDPQGGSTVARFQFDEPIIGLMTNSGIDAASDHFMLSDYLINPLVPLANLSTSHYNARGIEPGFGDYIHWFSDSDIEVHIGASSPGDQIRVITSNAAPEPATLATLVVGVATLMLRRRRPA